MAGIKDSIKWLSIFVMFQWACLVIFSCQVNSAWDEVESFKEVRKHLQLRSTKIFEQSKLVEYHLTEVEEKLSSIEEYLYLGQECAIK